MNSRLNYFFYISIIVISIFLAIFILNIWSFDLSVPFYYIGDSMQVAGWVKSIIDHGWYYTNSSIGMPFGQEMYDYPSSDLFNFFIIKVFSLFSDKFGFIMNLFFLIGFPLSALSATFVMRHLKFSYYSAFVTGILFAFLPFHFFRNETHMFLSFYWTIPLIILVLNWVFIYDRPSKKVIIISATILLVVSSSGIYYSFFSCILLVAIGIIKSIKNAAIKSIIFPLVLTSVIAIGCLANLSPTIIYSLKHEKNLETSHKNYGEAEAYGLKITQLVLPVNGHRIPALASLKDKYNQNYSISSGSSHAALGIIGSIGFVIMLFSLLLQVKDELLARTGKLNILIILLATIGGIGSIISFVVPEIRGYDRIGLFIAFLAFISFFSVVERLNSKSHICSIILYFTILVIGIFDQTTTGFAVSPDVQKEFNSDENFVNKIESIEPKYSMVFQLPYVAYPESPNVQGMADYSLSKGYLHSTNLLWSYGAMKGRYADLWQKTISKKSTPDMIKQLAYAGFQGIYIDRFGYPDKAKNIEDDFKKNLRSTPIVSEDGRLSYFSLSEYKKELNLTDTEAQNLKSKALYPIIEDWTNGFYGLEQDDTHKWRWSSKEGDLLLNNYSKEFKEININFGLTTGNAELSEVSMSGLINDSISVNNETIYIHRKVIVPPGVQRIHFETTARKLNVPDSRELFFNVVNFTIEE
ncbi:hypothetical protein ACHHV8_00315 [Paenibacillus sp. TAB 01]|uniref:hypothetical protein n=1 Tax=Paenibacillus sp. TAB 01 TaxID=3368988 RepID=UPI0037510D34